MLTTFTDVTPSLLQAEPLTKATAALRSLFIKLCMQVHYTMSRSPESLLKEYDAWKSEQKLIQNLDDNDEAVCSAISNLLDDDSDSDEDAPDVLPFPLPTTQRIVPLNMQRHYLVPRGRLDPKKMQLLAKLSREEREIARLGLRAWKESKAGEGSSDQPRIPDMIFRQALRELLIKRTDRLAKDAVIISDGMLGDMHTDAVVRRFFEELRIPNDAEFELLYQFADLPQTEAVEENLRSKLLEQTQGTRTLDVLMNILRDEDFEVREAVCKAIHQHQMQRSQRLASS